MTKTQRAWLAGWIEGEGSFFMGKKGTAAIFQAFSTDRDVIERVAKLLSAGVYEVKPRKHPGGWTSSVGWRVNLESQGAIDLMNKVYPLMCSRRQKKITEVLAAWEHRPNRPIEKLCACGCGRKVFGGPRIIYARRSGACAQNAYRRRQAA